MTPIELREEIRRLWENVKVHPEATGAMHPGGPAGQWVSISLTDSAQREILPSWIHFRMDGGGIEVAYGDGTVPHGALAWSPVAIAEIPAALREFAENFVESWGSFPVED